MAAPLLEVLSLRKYFGAVAASDGLAFAVPQGTVHALIGPNGAGKSTALGQITGEVRPDGGRIRFAGTDITCWPVHRRAWLGLQRSYQITSLFEGFTVLETVAFAVLARQRNAFRFWRPARRDRALTGPAEAVLDRLGLSARRQVPVVDLSHGEQRQLELAMVLATEPRMLLLDEPTAGMGGAETQRILEILRELKGRLTILLIEHDMDVVFALADEITVLVKGKALMTGAPAEVRADEAVRRAYLGEY